MRVIYHILIILAAYLLGSIPTSVWIGRKFYHIDIREHGSGNAGATNMIRVLGWKPGIPVLLFDVFKGWLAVNMLHLTKIYIPESVDFINFQLLLGIAALLGHIFPVYSGFRGGKGVATICGVVLALDPYSTLICGGIFIITLLITRYVSLSSMIAGFSYPIVLTIVFNTTTPSLVIFSMVVAILLLFTHQKNIERLLRKEESKADFLKFRKKKKKE